MIGRAPARRHSNELINATRFHIPLQERLRQTRARVRRVAQGLSARLRPNQIRVEIGGNYNLNNEWRDDNALDRHHQINIPPHAAEAHQEEHYLDIIRYHVTLVAEADRMLSVVSTRALLAGGIGAAGGGLGGAAAGAGAGAVAGDNLTCFSNVMYN